MALRTGKDKTLEKVGHKRIRDDGVVTFKRKTTYELRKAIQAGILASINSTKAQPKRDVLLKDFGAIETFEFRKSDDPDQSMVTSDFKFLSYAPLAYRFFIDKYQVDIEGFKMSICGQELRELDSAGSSGAVFYTTEDDEYIIKTIQHKEAIFVRKLLPEYFLNLTQHPRTLLPKFFGHYCYRSLGKNIRIVVMNNLIPSSFYIHEKFDLKGSTCGRAASAKETSTHCPTLKDLDFKILHPNGIFLEQETYDALKSTIERDCNVLESFRIMDYSLLLAIHNLDMAKKHQTNGRDCELTVMAGLQSTDETSPSLIYRLSPLVIESTLSSSGGASAYKTTSSLSEGTPLMPRVSIKQKSSSPQMPPSNFNSPKGKCVRGTGRLNIVTNTLTRIQSEHSCSSSEPSRQDQIATLPAGGIPAWSAGGDRLILFVGIIDILQCYGATKKMEFCYKSLLYEGSTISVNHPTLYARRFQSFICNEVFKKLSASMTKEEAQWTQTIKTSPRHFLFRPSFAKPAH